MCFFLCVNGWQSSTFRKVKPSSENFEITYEMMHEKRKIRDIFFYYNKKSHVSFEYVQLEKTYLIMMNAKRNPIVYELHQQTICECVCVSLYIEKVSLHIDFMWHMKYELKYI